MQPSARDSYLETQVMTASPQKLRLMLIEGAIRFVHQTEHYWDLGRPEEALESSIRAREIISELMSPLSADKSPLAQQMLPLYVYIFRTLTEANLDQNRAKLADALRVLAEERETWALVCEKFVEIQERPAAPVEITAAQAMPETAAAPVAPLSFDSQRMEDAPAAAPAMPRGSAPGRMPVLPNMPAPAPAPGFSLEA